MSKRTSLYAMGVWQKAAAAATNADIFEGAVGTASTNHHQIMGRVGIYHLF